MLFKIPIKFNLNEKKHALFYVFLIVFPALFVACVVIYSFYYTEKEHDHKHIIRVTEEIDHKFSELFDEVHHLMQMQSVQVFKDRNKIQKSKIRSLESFNEKLLTHNAIGKRLSWNEIEWIDINTSQSIFKPDQADRFARWHKLNQPWKLFISKISYNAHEKKYVLPANMGVTDENSIIRGYMYTEFDINELSNELSTLIHDPNIIYIILDSDLDVVLSSTLIQDKGIFSKDILSRRAELRPHKGALSPPILFEKYQFLYHRNIAFQPLTILVGVKNNYFLHKFFERYKLVLFLIIILISYFCFLCYGLFKKFFIDIRSSEQIINSWNPSNSSYYRFSNLFFFNTFEKLFLLFDKRIEQEYNGKKTYLEKLKNFEAKIKSYKKEQKEYLDYMQSLQKSTLLKESMLDTFFKEAHQKIQDAQTGIKTLQQHFSENLFISRKNQHHLLNKISDVLETAFVSTEEVKLKQTVYAPNIIQNCQLLLFQQFTEKKIEVVNKFHKGISSIEINETQLQKLILNIINCLIHNLPEKGTLVFSVIDHPKTGVQKIIIEDNGFGLPMQECEKFNTEKEDPYILQTLFFENNTGITYIEELCTQLNFKFSIETILKKGTIITLTYPITQKFPDKKENKEHEPPEDSNVISFYPS